VSKQGGRFYYAACILYELSEKISSLIGCSRVRKHKLKSIFELWWRVTCCVLSARISGIFSIGFYLICVRPRNSSRKILYIWWTTKVNKRFTHRKFEWYVNNFIYKWSIIFNSYFGKLFNTISSVQTKLYLFTGEKGPLLIQILHRALNQNADSFSVKQVTDTNNKWVCYCFIKNVVTLIIWLMVILVKLQHVHTFMYKACFWFLSHGFGLNSDQAIGWTDE
jgi:hypothetical protein